jgi:hypothetical protein
MIIRTPRPEAGFLILDNRTVRDSRLSLRARGLLALLLAFPDNWRTNSEHLVTLVPEGRDAVRKALAELEQAGYLQRQKRQDSAGLWSTVTLVFDRPQGHVENEPIYPPPTPEKPSVGGSGAIRRPNKKNLYKDPRETLPMGGPAICGECAGTGWTPDHDDTLHRCDTCTGGLINAH